MVSFYTLCPPAWECLDSKQSLVFLMAEPLIPTVDLSPFTKNDEDGKKQAMEVVTKACSEYGFFQIVNHGEPWSSPNFSSTILLKRNWKAVQPQMHHFLLVTAHSPNNRPTRMSIYWCFHQDLPSMFSLKIHLISSMLLSL